MNIIEITNLKVAYPAGFEAIKGINFSVSQGETVALVGESGCGKTTLVKAILGRLPGGTHIAGELLLNGEHFSSLLMHRARVARTIGYVSQDPHAAFDPLRRISHHLREPRCIHGSGVSDTEILAALERAGITDPQNRWRQYPHQWSGGMLQRAAITAATVLEPALLLADEPTSALDADLADGMIRYLRASSPSLLFITHDLELAARHADRIVVMAAGKIVQEGTPSEILDNPSHAATLRLTQASSKMLSCQVRKQKEEIIKLEKVSRSYGADKAKVLALDNISFSICDSEIVGIYGSSGSGKSTLLKVLAGIERIDSGEALYRNFAKKSKNIWEGKPCPGSILPIFQNPVASIDARWQIWRVIVEPLKVFQKLSDSEAKERAQQALDEVGLSQIPLTARSGELSVGQCQRVAIARALCARPRLLIADEPTASLDIATAVEISALFRKLSDAGTAIVVVSHDVKLLRSFSDRVLSMKSGKMLPMEDGKLEKGNVAFS